MLGQNLYHQKGQAIVEQLILWPTMVLLVLGTLQMALLYKDKAVFNDAVFRAAREGSLNNAYVNVMNKKLVEALAPIYQKKGASEAAYLDALEKAYKDNAVDPITGSVAGIVAGIRIDLITPNRSVFDAYKSRMYELQEGCEEIIERVSRGNNRTGCARRGETLFTQVPNDNLDIRAQGDKTVVILGKSVKVNLQDANLLKINAHWCAPLVVPFGRFALYQWQRTWSVLYASLGGVTHPHWPVCAAKTLANAKENEKGNVARIMYIPVTADAVVRMQSPIRCQGDERNGVSSRCRNLN